MAGCSQIQRVRSESAIIDARSWDFNEQGILQLNGDWAFYWDQLQAPGDPAHPDARRYVPVPGVWNDQELNDAPLPQDGYATYRLLVRTSVKGKEMGLRIPYHYTAYRLWINGNLMSEGGLVGVNKESSVGQFLPKYVYFTPEDNDLELVLQVSNFYLDKGGIPAAYMLGTKEQIRSMRNRRVAFDLFLAGCLFIMALYHLTFFLLRKKEVSALYFSIVCFLIMGRTVGLGEFYLIELFPDLDFEIHIKLIFVGFFVAPVLFIYFLQSLYPESSVPWLGKTYLGLSALFTLSLFFPADFSARAVRPFQVILLTAFVYMFYILINAARKRQDGALIALGGTLIIVATAINDILMDNQLISTDYYLPYGLFVFIYSQAFLLSFKFSRSFTAIENLNEHIQRINLANSRFVPSQFLSFLGKKSIVDVQLGDHVTKDMTIFFADIRSFTTLSENLTPKENFEFINTLLKKLSPLVRKNNGFVDKFIGDNIMALFPEDPRDALQTAFDVLDELREYNSSREQEGLPPVRLGFGINKGTLMLGTIGEEARMDGTVISDSVNIAARLEGLTKEFGATIIISGEVLTEVAGRMEFESRFLGNVQVKGRSRPVSIYEVFSHDNPGDRKAKSATRADFEEAIRYFNQGSGEEARVLFEKILDRFPEDTASRYYLNKIHPGIT